MTIIELCNVLQTYWPGAQWSMQNDFTDFDNQFEWFEQSSKPTWVEVKAKYEQYLAKQAKKIKCPTADEQLQIILEHGLDYWKQQMQEIKCAMEEYDGQ